MTDRYVRAAGVGDIGETESKAVLVGDYNVLICNTREGFFAVENECTHQLQELEGGKIRGCFIFCPLHGQRFNLKDGTPIGQLTDKPLKTFPLEVRGEDIFIRLNPAADKIDAATGETLLRHAD